MAGGPVFDIEVDLQAGTVFFIYQSPDESLTTCLIRLNFGL